MIKSFRKYHGTIAIPVSIEIIIIILPLQYFYSSDMNHLRAVECPGSLVDLSLKLVRRQKSQKVTKMAKQRKKYQILSKNHHNHTYVAVFLQF